MRYSAAVEAAIALVQPFVEQRAGSLLNSRWLSLKLLDQDESLIREISAYLGPAFLQAPDLRAALAQGTELLRQAGIHQEQLKDEIVSALVTTAESLCKDTVTYEKRPTMHRTAELTGS